MDDRTASEKIEDLTDRVNRLEAFIVRNAAEWDADDAAGMLTNSSLRENINQTISADCFITASLTTDA